jgi:hypothetical protein
MAAPRHIATLALAALSLLSLQQPALAQGDLAKLPAAEIPISIATRPDGSPEVSPSEIRLQTGKYYRFVVTSDGKSVWRMELPELLQNAHLRIVTIAGIEVQMQSMVFRAIEFDQAGTASFTLTPIRPGTYGLDIGRNPLARGRPIGQAGVGQGANTAHATIIVQ